MTRTIAVAVISLISAPWAFAGMPRNGDSLFNGAINDAFLQIRTASAVTLARMDESDLMELLRDRDAEVRVSALKTARYEMGIHTRVRDRVMEMARDGREEVSVRREAARTLHWINNMTEPRDVLLDLARRDRETAVRVMAYKALFNVSMSNSDVRDELRDAARGEREPEVRRAAIWALFDSTGDSDVSGALKDIAVSYREDDATRAEAVKSLYLAMGRSEVREAVLRIAQDYRTGAELRIPAVYALSAVRGMSEIDGALEDMIRGSDREVKLAAIKARSDDVVFFRSYFHLGLKPHPHQYISPLEFE
ncbi:MAG: hypothetical protein A2X36_07275 [Elusimicrobia bacterium GWA2_69_24]|nr:MAG: hypothetical protein A2X36_07275 [Elusimicrobia bacterium GWA2_69_24]